MVSRFKIKIKIITENGQSFDPHFEVNRGNGKLPSSARGRLKEEFVRPTKAIYETALFLAGAPFKVDRWAIIGQLGRAIWALGNADSFSYEELIKKAREKKLREKEEAEEK